MPVDLRTASRNWQKPNGETLQDDLLRLRAALDAADVDVAFAIAAAAAADLAADQAEASAGAASAAAASANGAALAARGVLGVTATDTTPAGLQTKIEALSPLTEAVINPTGNARLQIGILDATTTQKGAVRLANTTEATAGDATDIGVTPAGLAAALLASAGTPRLVRSARTANVKLVAANQGTIIDITAGTFTQTFDPAANLGNGWWVWLRNAGLGDVTLLAAASQTIDDLSSYVMYPGEIRLVQSDGTTLRSLVLKPFCKLFTANATFVKPPGYAAFDLDPLGGGGGGAGAGTRRNNVEDIFGGGGGAGGARPPLLRLPASIVGTTEAVTIGAGGNGGNGAAQNSNLVSGNAGGPGGQTSFGGHLSAKGGLGGLPATATGSNNGGTGGDALPGSLGPIYDGSGSVPRSPPTGVPVWGGGGGGASGDFGGAPSQGARSVNGGCGGGGGGGSDPTNGNWTVAGGGVVPPWPGAEGATAYGAGPATTGGGGAAGVVNLSANGNGGNGGAGLQPIEALRGDGGGGGGAGGQRGGDGGAGGRGGGGGGGGSGFGNRGGNGGPGGPGALRMNGIT